MGKGFYIVLFLCVATIGISGYYLLKTAVGGIQSTQPAGGSASVTIPDQSGVKAPAAPPKPEVTLPAPVETPVKQPTPAPAAQPDDPEPLKDQTPEPDTTSGQTISKVFTWPVRGAVLRDYSVETLSLDPTMGDWRTHSGLDIAAANGVKVLSISAGTVEQVYNDMLMGTTVVVDHGGGLQSWYCNLADEVLVEAGDTVDIGSELGTVGSSAIAEVGVDSHVHLETLLNGQPVDPREYLK